MDEVINPRKRKRRNPNKNAHPKKRKEERDEPSTSYKNKGKGKGGKGKGKFKGKGKKPDKPSKSDKKSDMKGKKKDSAPRESDGKFVTFSNFISSALNNLTVMSLISTAFAIDSQYIVFAIMSMIALPVGGRISSVFARPAWEIIAKGNRWLRDTIFKGYSWKWKSIPQRTRIVRSRDNMDKDSLAVLDAEIADAVANGALFRVSDDTMKQSQTTVVSGYFAVPKPSSPGQWRPIIDLRHLNKFLVKKTFQMTRYSDVASHIRRDSLMVTVDLTKAYFSIGIRSKLWRFLRICWRNIFYEFRCLCFGLTSAPRIFTKVTSAALFFVRSVWNISILGYIDDFIIFAISEEQACLHRDLFLVTMSLLGFQIREEKSSLVPSHIVKYLGFWWNSKSMTVSIPSKRISRIVDDASSFLAAGGLTVKDLERLIGRLESCRFVFQDAPLFYRSLQRLLNRYRGKYKKFLVVDRNLSAKMELLWWSSSFAAHHTFRSLIDRPVTLTITTDAAGKASVWDKSSKSAEFSASSFAGYGAYDDQGHYIQHQWSSSELEWHINFQELYGAVAALQSMATPGDHVLLRIDNTTAEAYLRKRGGTKSAKLSKLAVKAGKWMLENNIRLSLQHVSSEENDLADMLSRFHLNFWEFSLKRETFDFVVNNFKVFAGLTPTCDVFASAKTARMDKYCSWMNDHQAMAQDAFLMKNWTIFPYLFPPTPILARVIREIEMRKTKCLLIAPYWPHKPWFPHLQRMQLAAVPLPPAQDCLVHQVYSRVEAYVDPLFCFLLDGNPQDKRSVYQRQQKH